jgi:hypothetical protein
MPVDRAVRVKVHKGARDAVGDLGSQEIVVFWRAFASGLAQDAGQGAVRKIFGVDDPGDKAESVEFGDNRMLAKQKQRVDLGNEVLVVRVSLAWKLAPDSQFAVIVRSNNNQGAVCFICRTKRGELRGRRHLLGRKKKLCKVALVGIGIRH